MICRYPLFAHDMRSAISSQKNLLPPLPIDSFQWTQLSSKFDLRTVRRINRIMDNLQMTTLRDQVDLVSEILERELKASIAGAELSTIFGRKGWWTRGIIPEHIHQFDSPGPLYLGGPRLVDVPLEDDVIRCCLRRQQEQQPVTFV
jgi:hypothetical protein